MIDQRLIDDCVHCGFCLPTCPTYGPLWQRGDGLAARPDLPDGRAASTGRSRSTATVVEHFDRCLGCMACVTSCPSGVKYDRLIEQTREHVEQEHVPRPFGERLLRALVFAVVPAPAAAAARRSALAPLAGCPGRSAAARARWRRRGARAERAAAR